MSTRSVGRMGGREGGMEGGARRKIDLYVPSFHKRGQDKTGQGRTG